MLKCTRAVLGKLDVFSCVTCTATGCAGHIEHPLILHHSATLERASVVHAKSGSVVHARNDSVMHADQVQHEDEAQDEAEDGGEAEDEEGETEWEEECQDEGGKGGRG